MSKIYDVIVIGGGVVGGLILRELTKYKLRVCMVEKEYDVSSMFAKDDHHAGGDDGIIRDFVNMVRGGEVSISCTKIQDSVYGHLCVYKADESRIEHTEKTIEL